LLTPEWADHMLRFFNEPTSRSYVLTYAAGRDLCRAYVARAADGFTRLLSEQVRVGDLLDTNTRS
jgi:ferredoxin-NADP reductase